MLHVRNELIYNLGTINFSTGKDCLLFSQSGNKLNTSDITPKQDGYSTKFGYK